MPRRRSKNLAASACRERVGAAGESVRHSPLDISPPAGGGRGRARRARIQTEAIMNLLRALFVVALVLASASPALPQQRTRRPRRPRPAAPKPAPKPATPATAQLGVTTPSGLTYLVTKRGGGRTPKTGETVLVHYTGLLTDGTKFDSSRDRNEPIAFPLGTGRVIKGWDEGIAKLGVGDQAVLVIPPALGYGDRGAGGVIPAGATLVFVVELVDIRGPAVSQALTEALEKGGIAGAVARYRELAARNFAGYFASEDDLNGLGYTLLRQNRVADAVEIFKLNVEAHPASANVHDSLGEAYMLSGDTARAVESYRKSLELDPKNANASAMLEKLKAQ